MLAQLDFVQPNGYVALHGVELHVQSGEQIALTGPSGAGKTTLLSLMGSRLTPAHGKVTVLGQAVNMQYEVSLRMLRPRIGSIYQSSPLPAGGNAW